MLGKNVWVNLKKRLGLSLLAMMALVLFASASPKQASAEIDLIGSVGYMGHFMEGPGPNFHGFNVMISGGYNWGWLGASIDQHLSGIFYDAKEFGLQKTFVGVTTVNAKLNIDLPILPRIWLQAGIGALYFDKGDPLFAAKFGAGVTFGIIPKFLGWGLDFSYILSTKKEVEGHFITVGAHLRITFPI